MQIQTIEISLILDIFLPILKIISESGMLKATYKYIADGKKASTVDENGMGFDYLGSLVYNNDNDVRTLESTAFGGGRINATNNGYDINYFITDHLGSTRVVVDDSGNITEQNDYYPFGKRHDNVNLVSSTNRWGYNGKEKQTIYGLNYLDYTNRMYDDFIGRWFAQDPMLEKYYAWSPYAYCGNNPLRFIDPTGMSPEKYYDQEGSYLGQVGTNTDVRVINSSMSKEDALSHISAGTKSSATTLMNNSVAFADYFTTVPDVTNNAALQTWADNNEDCNTASIAQLSDAGVTQTGPWEAMQTKVNTNSRLVADPIGGAIRVQTELNKGKPVMVGVEQTLKNGNVRTGNNVNSLTTHFVVIRSSTVTQNGVSFNYLDNAYSGGKSHHNYFTLDTSTGAIMDKRVINRPEYSKYHVTEIRKNK